MKNNIRLGLGILTVLATPLAVDATTGSSEAHAAQDTVKSTQVAKTTNKEEVKTTTQKQVESATKTEATKVETTIKENTKVEGTKKEATVKKEEAPVAESVVSSSTLPTMKLYYDRAEDVFLNYSPKIDVYNLFYEKNSTNRRSLCW